ncbi:MAG: glutathione S-transferase [Luminiphilus sp.]|nr:glutathione S-transferase [Luminiphilus sp.]
MLKLYGFAVSNYFNMVRMTLAAKGLDYEVVKTFPSQSVDWVARSPMGKVPCLETEHGFIAETQVILEYLDEQYPDKPVLPTGSYDKARARQLMHSLELYLELPARRLFPGALFGGRNEELTIDEVKPVLEKGVRTINQLANCGPYLMGDTPMAPDYMALYVLPLAQAVAKKTYGWNLLADINGSAELLSALNGNEQAQQFNAESAAEMAGFVAGLKAK